MNYQKAADVQKLLSDPTQRILSKRGSAVVDARTNTLFVQDTPSRLEEVRKLIAKIDVAVRQVMIEARIVEANDDSSARTWARGSASRPGPSGHARSRAEQPARHGWRRPRRHRLSSTRAGRSDARRTSDRQRPANVNLPAAGLNAFNAGLLSFILFNSALTRFLNLELTALEADGKGKIISSPRVLTADKVEALIEQGTEIPYQQATSSGATACRSARPTCRSR